jgi:hypothetical protein
MSKPKREHRVTFYSPGTFFDEDTTKPIAAWDPVEAAKMATDIRERHGARPYGFQFSTVIVHSGIPDGEGGTLKAEAKSVGRSGMFYITGKIQTYDEASGSTLRSNMKYNDWPIVVETTNGYRHAGIFHAKDVIVDADGKIIRKGDDADLVAYREKMIAQWKAEFEELRRASR